MEKLYERIAQELQIRPRQVEQVVELIEKDNTIPFIARYRKEMTGGLDEVQISAIDQAYTYAGQLRKRKDEVLNRIDELGKLEEPLKKKIEQAEKLQEVEDLYLPYKQKRRTRATRAKEQGLEPLADWLMGLPAASIEQMAARYLSEEQELTSIESVLAGARDIIAERLADSADIRALARRRMMEQGIITVRAGKDKEKDEKKVYEMYYDYQEHVKNIVPHRILAINRGEKENILKVSLSVPEELLFPAAKRALNQGKKSSAIEQLDQAAEDACTRLILPAVSREIRQALTEKAERQAIHIFSENLRGLLLQPPMKEKIVLGVDPAYRTGCKLAVVDSTGRVLTIALIFPTPPKADIAAARKTVLSLIAKYHVDIVAIGNGTASRETEAFIAETLKEVSDHDISYLIVNEAGASVYSASALAREEFPDLHVEERSAISIARRLQDPLAELVKVDPKSVGVGEYQHDVSQKNLSESLGFVVETVVNRVGVNVNTASQELLQYIAGLSRTVAGNLVAGRNANGRYRSRAELKKVPRLGPRAFEQSAGFLRISGGDEPLDNTPIHPESYSVTNRLLERIGCSRAMLGSDQLKEKLETIDLALMADTLSIGRLTLKDIIEALIRPGRDPRDDLKKPLLKKDVLKMEDLREGMQLEGTVRNVVDFGAFVDIGVKQDGLVHISKLSGHFVKHPLDVVRVGQIVTVWVDNVSIDKGRVALTMIDPRKNG